MIFFLYKRNGDQKFLSIVSSFSTSLPTQRRVASPGNTYIFFDFYRTHNLKADSEEELEGWYSALRSKQVRVWD